jgi:FkbM family methyltransferase
MQLLQHISGVKRSLEFILEHPLASRDRRGALLRWVRWQVGSRILPGSAVVRFANDAVLVVEPGMAGATGNVYVGLHEFEDMSFLLHFARPKELFMDIGANVGSFTVLAAAVVGCECVSLEPVRTTYDRLMRNVSINGVGPRVRALNAGAGEKPGSLRFTTNLDCVNHVAGPSDTDTDAVDAVDVTTIDALLGDRTASVVKIDVEGFETPVVAGAAAALASGRIDAIIIELNGSSSFYGYDEDALFERLVGFGLTPCAYDPLQRALTPRTERSRRGNVIFVRDVADARRRVGSAPRVSVLGVSV